MSRLLDSISPANPVDARAAGFAGILRYLDNGMNASSCLVAGEAERYTAADFGIGSLWELAPDAAKNGENQGASDAARAVRAARALGQPKGTAIYGATDTDPAGLPAGAGVAYYRGFAQVRSSGYLAGCYAGAGLVNACLAAGVVDRVMLPGAAAWADGQVARRVDVDQTSGQVTIDGATFDVDTADLATAGLWTLGGPWPSLAPARPPTPQEDAVRYFKVQSGSSWWLVAFPTPQGGGWPWKLALATPPDGSALCAKFTPELLELSPVELDQLPTVKDVSATAKA